MALTSRQQIPLRVLRRHWYLCTSDIRDLIAAAEARANWDKDCSITRELMRGLRSHGLVRRHEPRLLEAGRTTAPPIWVLSQRGSCELASATGNTSDILTVEPTFKDFMSLHHNVALARQHVMIDAAVRAQNHVTQHGLIYEHEVVDQRAEGGARYRCYTVIEADEDGRPTVVCNPDTMFEVEVRGARRVFATEREMGSDSPGRVAAKKCKGHAGMAGKQLFKGLFPQAADYRVLAFCPNDAFRKVLMHHMRDKPGAELWLFCDARAVTAQTFLHGEIFWRLQTNPAASKPEERLIVKGPIPLIPPPPSAPPSGNPPAARGSGGA